MADKGFDPCEYIWSSEFAMQRLLYILRQTQHYCTDNECFNQSQLPGPRVVPPTSDFFMTCLIIGFFALMYVLRPKSLRQAVNDNTKGEDNAPGSDNGPPAPSTTN